MIRPVLLLSVPLIGAVLAAPAGLAATIAITPLVFEQSPGRSIVATGTLTTGPAPGTISDWSLAVTTVTQLARYTPANTLVEALGLVVDNGRMTVATAPDGSGEGGLLGVRAPSLWVDFGALLADFSGPAANGGQASYRTGSGFDLLALDQPFASTYEVAQQAGSGAAFTVAPLEFGAGVTLSGTITTDGTSGALTAAQIRSWDLALTQIQTDLFDPGNSRLQASGLGLDGTGTGLTVARDGGYLGFSKGTSGGHPLALVLADFSDPAQMGGWAGYYQGRQAVTLLPLPAGPGDWAVTGGAAVAPAPVPVPAPAILLGGAIALLTGLARRLRRPASGRFRPRIPA